LTMAQCHLGAHPYPRQLAQPNRNLLLHRPEKGAYSQRLSIPGPARAATIGLPKALSANCRSVSVDLHSQGSQRLVDQALHKNVRRCCLRLLAKYVTVIPNQSTKLAMRSSVESALLLYDRESRYFHIRHSRGGQPPALFAGHEPEYSKV